MIYILFSFLLIFPILMGFGKLFQNYFGSLWNGISGQLVSGIILLMVVWHLLAFFSPINFYVELISVLIGFFLFFYYQSYRIFLNFDRKNGFLWLISILISSLVGSGYPFILDHFGYYVPSIKWIAEFGLVRGITNLDWVLGQMSPWHIFQAGFSHFSDPFLRINTLVLGVFFLYIMEKKSWAMLCFSPILFLFVQSPSPDLPVIVFSLMILNEILQKNRQFSLLFAFSVLVFSIKPTMFWLPMLTFFYPIFIFKQNLKFIGWGAFLSVLYIVKNLWVFGYPFFPMEVIDLDISWKPYDALFTESKEIAVLKTFDLQYTLEEIAQFSTGEYIWNWLFLKGIKGIINLGLIFSLVVFGIYTIRKGNLLITLVFTCILAKTLFVLWFSAQYRFFIEVFFVIFIILFRNIFTKKHSLILFSILSLGSVGLLFFPNVLKANIPSFHLGSVMKGFELKQIYKPSHYVFNRYSTHKLGNLTFNVPQNYIFGFDVALPVITLSSLEEFETLGFFPQLKGEALQDGFIWKKLENREKQQLRLMIEKIKEEK
ncbi:MAG: hypothetical protein Q4A00_02460 [Flavobacteriaceae bacterium]|nr:hypothetical protein [Flavobacteriaceae bacterium]